MANLAFISKEWIGAGFQGIQFLVIYTLNSIFCDFKDKGQGVSIYEIQKNQNFENKHVLNLKFGAH
jgi:hypothetical protein